MPKIRALPPHVADLIAAGEVVERPASAAKELIENAVDAGASSVVVEITGGGSVFLRVTDDGSGMSPEDAQTAFQRHATSKIRTAEDLTRIKTLGFRGEALAAIAAVSRVDLLTREQGSDFGTAVRAEGGAITEASQAGCPLGTTVIIRDLFYNTPARRAFLKKDNYESLQIQNAVVRAAQSRPDIAFSFMRDGREEIRTPGGGSLSACLHSLWGRETASNLIKIETKHLGGALCGYAARPAITRGSREMQYFFVNGRPVRSRSMYAGLEEAFRHAVPSGRHPVCSLHLTISEELYDVNVHPAKLEVKFANERAVYEIINRGVSDALSENPEHKRWTINTGTSPAPPVGRDAPDSPPADGGEKYNAVPPPFVKGVPPADGGFPSYAKTRANTLTVEQPSTPPAAPPPYPVGRDAPGAPSPAGPGVFPPAQQTLPPAQDFRYIGEALGGFLIVERDDALILIDKHAAHERKLFEQLAASSGPPLSQILIAPAVITLAPPECAVILENEGIVAEIGFEISEFGGASLAVRALPEGVDVSEAAPMLSEIAAILRRGKRAPWEEIRESLLEMIACKSAVKIGRRLSEEEALEVVRWVLKDNNIFHCPHGRPVAVVMTKEDIYKQFLRG
ncbi:MAG: DNA mismatch repair endonuclease MutL [Oscillospiraceae bacterium]|nr:DNA mismatch repair endonuclease MutL [Oscillospiraceae bacterium]